MPCVTWAAMKTAFSRLASSIAVLTMSTATLAGGAPGKELEVIEAMAAIVRQDSTRPYDFLYFESDFSAGPHVASSMANPDRTQFCGLARAEAQSLVAELETVNSKPVSFDKDVARNAGLKIGHKKLPRFRYLMLSRVVFSPDHQRAWLAVDQNGETGAIMRLDKVGGQWTKTHRCGGWLKMAE
jgi:hypothetical protein